jgi:hypothetical protein
MSNLSCHVDGRGHLLAGVDISALDPRSREFPDTGLTYEYDLSTRTPATIPSDPYPLLTRDWHTGEFFDRCAGTPEKLMAFARNGVFEKMALATLLRPEVRQTYLDACGIIEEAIVAACAAKGEPCLAGGCAAEGETCLEACLSAAEPYHTACAAAWIEMFKDPDNRIDSWRK